MRTQYETPAVNFDSFVESLLTLYQFFVTTPPYIYNIYNYIYLVFITTVFVSNLFRVIALFAADGGVAPARCLLVGVALWRRA